MTTRERMPPLKVLERRARVARLMATMDKPSVRRIAEQLNTPRATIQRDMEAIRHEWKQERLRGYEDRVATELAKLDLAEQEAWRAVVAAQRPRVQTRRTTRPVEEVAEDGTRRVVLRMVEETQHIEPEGGSDIAALNTVLKVMERRARLLGLDAVEKVEHGDTMSFVFTLRIGDTTKIINASSDDAAQRLLTANSGVRRVRFDSDGRHHPETITVAAEPVPNDHKEG